MSMRLYEPWTSTSHEPPWVKSLHEPWSMSHERHCDDLHEPWASMSHESPWAMSLHEPWASMSHEPPWAMSLLEPWAQSQWPPLHCGRARLWSSRAEVKASVQTAAQRLWQKVVGLVSQKNANMLWELKKGAKSEVACNA